LPEITYLIAYEDFSKEFLSLRTLTCLHGCTLAVFAAYYWHG